MVLGKGVPPAVPYPQQCEWQLALGLLEWMVGVPGLEFTRKQFAGGLLSLFWTRVATRSGHAQVTWT